MAANTEKSAIIFAFVLRWHSRGRRFDPDYLHHIRYETLQGLQRFYFFLDGAVQAVI